MVGVPEANVEPFVPRVTLTLPALASCREMLFEVVGRGQARDLDARARRREPAGGPRAFATARPSGSSTRPRFRRILVADEQRTPCALIVMGVSGSGKSTIAERLAERLGWPYEDGDRFHPASNVAKMSAGHPLTDEDRWPWLQAIADEIDRVCEAGERAS